MSSKGVNCVKTVIKGCYNITKLIKVRVESEVVVGVRISTLAEVLAPWLAPAELSATPFEVCSFSESLLRISAQWLARRASTCSILSPIDCLS